MDTNSFKYSAPIPAPLGSTVYRFWTSCCDACWMQVNRDKRLQCDVNAICHTRLHSISAIVVDYNNLTLLIDGWGKNIFATYEEAEIAANTILNEHRKAMAELGYVLDEDGKVISTPDEAIA